MKRILIMLLLAAAFVVILFEPIAIWNKVIAEIALAVVFVIVAFNIELTGKDK